MGAREWGDELCSEVFHLFCDIINGHIFCANSLEISTDRFHTSFLGWSDALFLDKILNQHA